MKKHVANVLIFDVDGVITNIQEKKVTEDAILPELGKLLRGGNYIVFNTGRAISWVEKVVLDEMKPFFVNRQEETHIFTVGEFGGTWAYYKRNNLHTYVDPDLKMPKDLQQEIKHMVEEEFPGLVFFDDSKLTMISVEMHDRVPLTEFKKQQPVLSHRMEKILGNHPKKNEFKFRPGRIANDIMSRHAGKDLGAQRILEWLESNSIKPLATLTFGDTETDLEMAKKLHSSGFPVKFIYTADPNDLKDYSPPFGIIFTKQDYERGTLEFLRLLSL